jgi:hypothetical protein
MSNRRSKLFCLLVYESTKDQAIKNLTAKNLKAAQYLLACSVTGPINPED